MAVHLVIATHGPLAQGFAESMKFIIQPENPVHTICAFTQDPDPGAAFDRLLETFCETDTVVVLTDLLGGSVNKAIAQRLCQKRFHLIAGVNLATVLEFAVVSQQELTDAFVRDVVSAANGTIVYVNDSLSSSQEEESFF